MIEVIYRRLAQIGRVAGALTFLFGIPYGVFQYWQIQKDKTTEQTLNFFKLYNGIPFTGYRETASKVFSNHKDEIKAAAADVDTLTTTLMKIIKEENAETAVIFVIDFFDGVAVCIYEGLCYPETTYRLFGSRAREYYVNFYQYIVSQRNGLAPSKFGRGLEAIAKASPN